VAGTLVFSKAHLSVVDGMRSLEIDGTRYPVERDVAGESNLLGLEVAARIGSLLGTSDEQIRQFLAHPL